MAKPVPREVGLQVPRRDRTEVPEEVVVRAVEEPGRPDPEGAVPAEGGRGDRGARDAGPRAYVPVDPAEVQRGVRDRVAEGQERGADPPPGRGEAGVRPALLVRRVLREYRRARRADDPRVHPAAGEAGDRPERVRLRVTI